MEGQEAEARLTHAKRSMLSNSHLGLIKRTGSESCSTVYRYPPPKPPPQSYSCTDFPITSDFLSFI